MNNENNTFETETANESTENASAGYTAPEQPPYTYPPVKPTRRVGTLTMGFALIVTGVVALIATFNPSFDLATIFKLSPIIFVFLGIEILVGCFFHKGEKLRYDFLSGFVCFILICGGVCISVVPSLWNHFGPPAEHRMNDLEREADNILFERLRSNGEISDVQTNLDWGSYYGEWGSVPVFEDLNESTVVYVNIDLSGDYADEMAFAASCKTVLNSLTDLPFTMQNLHIRSSATGRDFSVSFRSRFEYNMSVENIAKQVDLSVYDNYDEDWNEPTRPDEDYASSEQAISSEEVAPSSAVMPETVAAPLAPEISSSAAA